jgi:hypothetical protein
MSVGNTVVSSSAAQVASLFAVKDCRILKFTIVLFT